uniref:Inactive hydroxysteroid dehydrogenase-like protein 1 n=1 Tax=Ciona intestinalis TaxID=7719 RepID=F6TA16_CIOIN|nr:inactive hydroxysteroid dehydrogenase-like protein 1 [Ciona intestinalis]|eukprot:XP_002130269.1 inactive hydroxysteroid dehydrogenase-like protein 1 [Ciona intestinalis]
MAAVDSVKLLVNQMTSDLQNYSSFAWNLLSVIGAWYTLKYSVKFCCWFISCCKCAHKYWRKRNFVKEYGRWAVVTGCSSGIGKQFMHKLAEHGLNIILVSRNKDCLEEEAKFIETAYGVQTLLVVQDLENLTPEITQKIQDRINELDIGILINNAGLHESPKSFTEVEISSLHAMVQVNMNAVVAMTAAVLPGMLSRQRGLIVNMSSGGGMFPVPLISLYSSTKAFVDHFSQALHYEVASKNIHVQSLTPMYISTRMTDYSTTINSNKFFTPSVETYVKHALPTLGRFRSNTGYFPHTIQCYFAMLCPRFLVVKFSHRMQLNLQKEAASIQKKAK